MPKLTTSAPILLVRDVVHSANWYKDKLGFTISGIWDHGGLPHTAILERDGLHLMFYLARPDQITPLWKIVEKTSNIYFWVDDVETLYKEFIASGATIDFTLYKTPWGTMEFGISDPDEYDVTFGQVIK
jgi:uncharacterized glyoxalase superfamily protein PhnB